MADFLMLMHSDAGAADPAAWVAYIEKLRKAGAFEGGSAIGGGKCFRKAGKASAAVSPISGFMRITASDLQAAEQLLAGNPAYEAGGTVEFRELPKS